MDTKKLRQKILDLAIHGKLVPQDPNDEPASVLLERIREEKERLIKEGKIKKSKKSATSDTSRYENVPFQVPEGWCWCRLGEIAQSNIGLTYKPSDVNLDGTPVMRSNNIQERKITLDDIVRVSTTILDNQYLNVGDLLICARNGSRRLVGKCAIIKELTEPTSFGAFMAVCRSIYNPWIDIILNSNYFVRYLDDSNSTTIHQVTQKMLLELLIPLPPVNEQERIVKNAERWTSIIDSLECNENDIRESIQNTKSKILDLAISGKLVPQDVNDEPASALLRRLGVSSDNRPYENLPEGWAVTSLANLCSNINGLWKGKKEPFVNVGVIRNANFTKDFKLDYTNIEYLDVEEKAFSKRLLNNGDLIVEKSGGSDKNPVGRAILYEGENGKFSFSNFTMALRIKDYELITSKYLYFFLLNKYKSGVMASMQTQTTGLHNLILDKYLSMDVALPPLPEQTRIVSKIEELFSQLDFIANTLE